MKQRVKMFSLLPLMTFAVLVVCLLQPLSASAATVKSGTHVTYTRQHTTNPNAGNLIYHGGPVMAGTANAYAIFWEPPGSFVSSTYNSLIERYFGDIGPSKLYRNDKQYTQNGGGAATNAVLAGSWVDTAAYPGNPISDAQVQQEVTHAQKVNGWNSSIDNIFFVFTAKGENICASFGCSFQVFCAYHGFFGSNTIYAAMPYTGTDPSGCGVRVSPNKDFDADSTINVTSHEQNEAATDPLLNAWYDSSGEEIGDKCAWNFGPTKSYGGDVKLNGHPYEVQKEWDNHVSGCVLKGP
ncbi:MAG TPA: hypothetical protein VFA09_16500 [Ktedonobacteraceae bacterium]|nr:hypothetical protein [Ktedonobacteraceae bacterium]